jgi:predicted RNA binding protein with dsRBD fold (UPF0201 family)
LSVFQDRPGDPEWYHRQTHPCLRIHFGSDPEVHFTTCFAGVTQEQTNSETARGESERSKLTQDAFWLDVQKKASVVGVMAFAENTPF